ncbi:MAG TPA: hypothetical protein VLT58_18645, partial [Polyangia bacterium]|nr:hypothetical protein [Polyangia bacterium]
VTRVRLFDAIAGGFGLNLAEREELARERRGAEGEADSEMRREADVAFRAVAAAVRAALIEDEDEDGDGDVVRGLRGRLGEVVGGIAGRRRGELLKTVLHLSSVRFMGGDPDGERLAYTVWQRAREGLRRAPGRRR